MSLSPEYQRITISSPDTQGKQLTSYQQCFDI